MRKRSWTDEQVAVAVVRSFSLLACLQKLGLHPAGGNYRSIRLHIERLGLDNRHWTGQSQSGDRSAARRRAIPLEAVLVENSTYLSIHCLKKRLLREGLLQNVCSICGRGPEWNGAPLVLILDHVNGKHRDHRIKNLRLVCPNCGSQLPTFAGRNKKKDGSIVQLAERKSPNLQIGVQVLVDPLHLGR